TRLVDHGESPISKFATRRERNRFGLGVLIGRIRIGQIKENGLHVGIEISSSPNADDLRGVPHVINQKHRRTILLPVSLKLLQVFHYVPDLVLVRIGDRIEDYLLKAMFAMIFVDRELLLNRSHAFVFIT